MNSLFNKITDQNIFFTEKNRSRLFHRSLFFSYFLLVVMIALVLTLVFIAIGSFSNLSREKQKTQMNILINEEKELLSNLNLEYGWWNDTIEYIVYNRDIEWSEDNIGYYLIDYYGLSWSLVYDISGNLIYGRHKDEIVESLPLSVWK